MSRFQGDSVMIFNRVKCDDIVAFEGCPGDDLIMLGGKEGRINLTFIRGA